MSSKNNVAFSKGREKETFFQTILYDISREKEKTKPPL